jgi:exonuclease VII large subunit
MFKVTFILVVSLSMVMGQNLNWQTQIQTQLQQALANYQQYQTQFQQQLQQWQQYYAQLPVNVQQYIQQLTQLYSQQMPADIQSQIQQFFNQKPNTRQGYYMPGPPPPPPPPVGMNGSNIVQQQGQFPPPPPPPPQGLNGSSIVQQQGQLPPPPPPPPQTNGSSSFGFQQFQFFPPPPPSVNATSALFKLIFQQQQQQQRALYVPTLNDVLTYLPYLQLMDPTMKKMYSDLYKAYLAGGYEGAKKEFLTTYGHVYEQYKPQFQMYFSIVPEAQIASFISTALSNPSVAAMMAALGN